MRCSPGPVAGGEGIRRTEADGLPEFKGYRKVDDVPEFFYRIGEISYTLRITPGEAPGVAECYYTETNATGDSRSYTRMRYPADEEGSR